MAGNRKLLLAGDAHLGIVVLISNSDWKQVHLQLRLFPATKNLGTANMWSVLPCMNKHAFSKAL